MKRLIFCGGRDFSDRAAVTKVIRLLISAGKLNSHTVIIHGGARGTDTLAGSKARAFGLKISADPSHLLG